MEDNHTPVNIDLYHELEVLATTRKSCELIFKHHESRTAVRGKIEDVFMQDDNAFLRMDTGLEIQLDCIIQLDAKLITGYC